MNEKSPQLDSINTSASTNESSPQFNRNNNSENNNQINQKINNNSSELTTADEQQQEGGDLLTNRPSLGGRKLSGGPSRITTFTKHPLLRPIAKGFRSRVLRFQSSWFSVTMGTGIVSSLLFDLPWSSSHPAFRAIATAFLLFDIILFLSFTLMSIARYVLYPAVFSVMIKHETDSLFSGCIVMGMVTIVSGIARIGTEYGLEWTLDLGLVLWWIALSMSFPFDVSLDLD